MGSLKVRTMGVPARMPAAPVLMLESTTGARGPTSSSSPAASSSSAPESSSSTLLGHALRR
jgi:hypothetical protein